MAEMIKVNKKVIHDPMYTPVRKFLTERIAQLEIDGSPEELAISKERYESLIAGDIVIEDVKTFKDGIQRVCIVARKTGFARADIEFKTVKMQEILDDFGIPFVEIADIEALKTFSKTNDKPAVLLWLTYKNTYGVLLTQEAAKTIEGPMEAFGNLFFNQYTTERETLDYIDYDTIESGTVTVTDPSIGAGIYPLFIQELVLNEANLPIITSNLPEFITTSRGNNFTIPNTYWFGGTLDITQTATIEITTGQGYTIPVRSDDKLFINGETIYGSSKEPVTDVIIVRVTHMYQGRPVKRTFRIEVRIEQDTAFDLTFEVTPDTIKASRGDEIQVIVQALFKGQPVTIASPPAKFESPKKYGDLTYVETLPDGKMVYSGKITGTPPGGQESDKDLYAATFNYIDGSTPYEAPAFINLELVRADVMPKFTIKGLTTTLRGYIDDVKKMEVKAFYGDEPVSATELRIRLGSRGDKELIRFDSVEDEAVNYTVIRDSQKPGEEVEDEFDQTFTYLDPFGVRQTVIRTIKIIIQKLSVIEIIPTPPLPRPVTRYQKGGPLWKVMVNGKDETNKMIGLAMVSDETFVKFEGGQWNIIFSGDEDKVVPAKFTWKQPYDGANHDHEFEGEFLVKKWDPNTNPGGDGDGGETGGGGDGDGGGNGNNEDGEVNNAVVVFPMYWGIGGLSSERGQVRFRVYSDGKEITEKAVQVTSRKVMPAGLRDEGVVYDPADGMLVWTYYKVDPIVDGVAKLFYKDPKDANPGPDRLGRMYITANVKQSRVLKVIEISAPDPVIMDKTADATVRISFAGEEIALTDPLLTIKYKPPKQPRKQVTLVNTAASSMTFGYNTLQYPGSSYGAAMEYELSLTDPVTGELQTLDITVPMTIKIPPLDLQYVPSNTVDTRMWETGVMPFKVMCGERDLTGLMGSPYQQGTSNKYVGLGGRNWTIVNAEKEAFTTTVSPRYTYYINSDYPVNYLYVSVIFNIDGWDGITFRADVSPTEIVGKSGTGGEIVGDFVYKYDNVTNGIRLNRSRSVIPDNILIEDPVWDPVREKAIIKYNLIRGYKYPMKLVFEHPTINGTTVDTNYTVDVEWPEGLNLESTQSSITGYHTDVIDFPLVYNFSGVRLKNSDPNLVITYISKPNTATSLVEQLDDKLRISLDQGGAQGTTYDAQAEIRADYTNPEDGQLWDAPIQIPVKIMVPTVKVGANPNMVVNVYNRGQFRVTLVDSRGKTIPITIWSPNGTNNYIAFVAPNQYYVTKGDTTQSVITEFPLTLGYEIGGQSYTLDATVNFQINTFNGIDFTAKSLQTQLNGKAGEQGEAKFEFTYKGDVTHAVTLAKVSSIIPPNLLIGELSNSILPYTLKGQGRDEAVFGFVRANAPANPVEGKDFAVIKLPVISESSDEPFTIVSSDDEIELDWRKTGVLKVVPKYGDYELAANAPGLKYTLRSDGDQGVVVLTPTKEGITLRGELASIPGTKKSYLDLIEVSYDVGTTEPKKQTISFNTRISTPLPTVTNNDVVATEIWARGIFTQSLNFNADPTGGVIAPTTRLKIVPQTVPNQYVEMYTSFSYEVIGAPPTTQTVQIPVTITYTLKGVEGELTHDFNIPLNIKGHTAPRFYCEYSPKVSEGVLDETREVRFRPLLKDQYAPTATFRQDLSTLPAQVEIVDVKKDPNNGEWTIVTLKGIADGVGQAKFVWWSPEAVGPNPDAEDAFTANVECRIMGEPGIEIGDRDNLIVGKHKDTGTYKLEVLFGGIPLNIHGEIGKGLLTITPKAYNATDKNAGVLSITDTGSDTFNYALTGPLYPGHTADTKEILQLSYKYGGQTYTANVEVPLQYTTSDVVITGKNLYPNNVIFQPLQAVTGIKVMCDDVDLASTWTATGTLAQPGVQSKYVKYTGRQYDIISADVTASTKTITTTFASTYRGYPWSGDMDLSFEIGAWDQKTYRVKTSNGVYTFGAYIDDKVTFQLLAEWRNLVNQRSYNAFNPDKTDLQGLIDFEYKGHQNGYDTYEGVVLSAGEVTIPMWFDRQNDTTNYPIGNPPVENYDYALVPFNFKFTEAPLVISAPTALTGGNDDLIGSGTITVKLRTLNIPINDPNLTIEAVNPEVMVIEARNATTVNYRVKLPLDTTIGEKFNPVFKYSYKNPSTGKTHVGEQTVPFTYRNPADYPVLVVSPGFTNQLGGNRWLKLPSTKRVQASGKDITGQVISFTSSSPKTLVEILQPFDPNAQYWLQYVYPMVNGGFPGDTYVTYSYEVPYRDGTVILTDRVNWFFTGQTAPWNPFAGTYSPTPVQVMPGVKGKIEFNLTFRGEATANVNLNTELSDFKGLFTVDSIEKDGVKTIVNFTGIKEGTAATTFVWELPNQDAYEDNYNRGNMSVNFVPGLTIVLPEVPPVWEQWKTYYQPFDVQSGGVSVLNGAADAGTDKTYIERYTQTAQGIMYRVMNAPKEAGVITIKFIILLNHPNFKGTQLEIDAPVNFTAWNGITFEAYLPSTGLWYADDGKPIISIARGRTFTLTMTSKYWDPLYPNGNSASSISYVDQGLMAATPLVQWVSAGAAPANFITTIRGVSNGYVPAKLAVDMKASGNPNGFPPGTEGKNRHTMDVYYEVFEPEFNWAGGTPPAPVVFAFNENGWVERQLFFGRTPINYRTCTITIRAEDQNKVVMGTPVVNYDQDRFFIKNVYDNQFADLETTVQITVTGKVDNVTYTKTWDQPVVLKGKGGSLPELTLDNVTPVSGKTWDRGALPFKMNISGSPLAAPWTVKDVTITPNPLVKMAVNKKDTYVIYGGDKTKPMTQDVVFNVVVTDGAYELTKSVTVKYDIPIYDGVEFILKPIDAYLSALTWYPSDKVVAMAYQNNKTVGVEGTFQGEPFAPRLAQMSAVTVPAAGNNFTITSGNNAGTGNYTWTLQPGLGAPNMPNPIEYKFLISREGKGPGLNGPGVEGIDYAYVPIKVLGYASGKMYPIKVDEVVEGKLGDTVTVNGTFRMGITQANLGAPRVLSFNPPVIVLPTNPYRPGLFYVNFAGPIDKAKVETNVTGTVQDTNTSGSSSTFPLKVIQHTTVEEPTIDQTMDVNVVVSDKGHIPFRVTSKGVNVTDQCKNIQVSGSTYVRDIGNLGTEDVWEVIASEVAGVTSPVKFTFDIVVDGVTFTLEQSINFVIAPFVDNKLDVKPASNQINVGIGKTGALKFTGSWGENPIATTVVYDADNSQLGDLITVQGATPNADGSLTINYTGGAEMKEGEVTFRFKAINGNATPVEGYDWVDVKVNVNVMLTLLEKVEPFETEGKGTVYAPAVLEQQVSYNGVALDNNDPDLKISLSSGAKVAIHEKTANSITYRFLVKQATEVIHAPSVTFEYKGVAVQTVVLKLTQELAAADPIVSEPVLLTVENNNYYKVPFTILSGIDGRDITSTLKIKSILFDGKSQYFNIDENSDTFGVVYFDKKQLDGTAKYEVTVIDGTGEVTVVVDGPMRILPNNKTTGLTAEIISPEGGRGVVIKGQNNVVKAKIMRNGEYVANSLIEVDPTGTGYQRVGEYQSFNLDPDGYTINVVLRTTSDANVTGPWPVPVKFVYIPDKDKTQEAGVTFVVRNFNLLPVGPTELAFVWEEGLDYNNFAMGLGDNYEISPMVYYGATRLRVNQCTWSLVNPNTDFNNSVRITGSNETTIFMIADRTTTVWGGAYLQCTYQGVSKLDWKSFNVFPGKTYVNPKQESTPAPNKTTDFMFSTPTPVLPWNGKQNYTFGDGPRWTSDKTNLLSGRFEFTDPVKNVTTATDLVDAVPDNVGRYHVPVTMTHIPMTVKLMSAVVRGNAKEKPTVKRATAPVANTEWKLPGAPVLATIDDNIVDMGEGVSTTISFRLSQVRASGIYRFAQVMTFVSVDGPADYVSNSIADPATQTQSIILKGKGTIGDVTVNGTVTDEDGYTYPVTLKLKTQAAPQVTFELTDTEIGGYTTETFDVKAVATYQGSNLPLNHADVELSVEPDGIIEIVSTTATTIKVKIVKEVTADEALKVNLVLRAFTEVHKDELTVGIKSALPPLVVTEVTDITGGNGDTGSSSFMLTMGGMVVNLNDPKLTITPADLFEITETKVGSFLYKITAPLGDNGIKSTKVKLVYTQAPGITSETEFDQKVNVTNPADYPRIISNPNFALDPYIYGFTPIIPVVMSGTDNISTECYLTDVASNAWVLKPEGEPVPGKWLWVVDGPVQGQAATKVVTMKLAAPFRGEMVELQFDQSLYWSKWPTIKPTRFEITHSPEPVKALVGDTGEIEFSVKWAGAPTTVLSLSAPSFYGYNFGVPFVRDGKMVVAWTAIAAMQTSPSTAGFVFTKMQVPGIGNNNSYSQVVTFKEKNDILLTFGGTKNIEGGTGAQIGVPFSLTRNGVALTPSTPGVTIATSPTGVLEYVNSSSSNMNFKFMKKVDSDTTDVVKVTVSYLGDTTDDSLTVKTKPAFWVESVPENSLTFKRGNVLMPLTVTAWYGTNKVPANSPDLVYAHKDIDFRGGTDTLQFCKTKLSGTGGGGNAVLTITHKPSGGVFSKQISTSRPDTTSISVVVKSLGSLAGNTTGRLIYTVGVGANDPAVLDNISTVKLISDPDTGNAILTQSVPDFNGTNYQIGFSVTTGWTGKGTRVKGFVHALRPGEDIGWYEIDTIFANVTQVPLTSTLEKATYLAEATPVNVKFRLNQMQGTTNVKVDGATFGAGVPGGEIASVGDITATGDPQFPYQVTVTPTGNIGTGTVTGVARVNGIDYEYRLTVQLDIKRWKLIVSPGSAGETAANPRDIKKNATNGIGMILTYGDDIVKMGNKRYGLTFGAGSMPVSVDRAAIQNGSGFDTVWLNNIANSIITGTNTITITDLDDPTKTATTTIYLKLVDNTSDWRATLSSIDAPGWNEQGQWHAAHAVAPTLGGNYYVKHLEIVPQAGPLEPVISIDPTKIVDLPSPPQGHFRVPMVTGWTGGTVQIRGIVAVEGTYYLDRPATVTIPQSPVVTASANNDVQIQGKVDFTMHQVRGFVNGNWNNNVNLSTIPGITFKNIAFNAAVISEVTNMKQAEDGTFSLEVKIKEDATQAGPIDITATVTIEKVDYPVKVTINVVIPAALVAPDDFPTVVRGNTDNPVTLTQTVYLPN
uniref:PA14 domain-containing protein n=1 Tax=Pantoea phage Survivor TaxID=3232176 RepID=A0AAU8L0W1_9CAUD